MSQRTMNLIKKAANLDYPTDSTINEAINMFKLFLVELNVPEICFSSSSKQQRWYFSDEGEKLFIDFYRNSARSPYVHIRKGRFSPEFSESYVGIIDAICKNLSAVRKLAKKGQIEDYPSEDSVIFGFWVNILHKTGVDFSVLPGASCVLKTSKDQTFKQLLTRASDLDVIFIDRIILEDYRKLSKKWEAILNKMSHLRVQEYEESTSDSLCKSLNPEEMIKLLINSMPPEPVYTKGCSSDKVNSRIQEIKQYRDEQLIPYLNELIHELQHQGINFLPSRKASAEIYEAAIKEINACLEDNT